MRQVDIRAIPEHLGLSLSDRKLSGWVGDEVRRLCIEEYSGSIDFKELGFELVFQQASSVPKQAWRGSAVDQDMMLVAVHMHAKGHEGYEQFDGQLPMRLTWGMRMQEAIAVSEEPICAGAHSSKLLSREFRWLRYERDAIRVQCEFGGADRLVMISMGLSLFQI